MEVGLIITIAILCFLLGILVILICDYIWEFLKKNKISKMITKAHIEADKIINQRKAKFKIEQQKTISYFYEKRKESDLLTRKEKERLEKESAQLTEMKEDLKQKAQNIDKSAKELETLKNQTHQKRIELNNQLEKIAGLTQNEALEKLLENTKKVQTLRLNKITKERIQKTEAQIENKIQNILALAIERYSGEYIKKTTSKKIELESDEIKGKIIGKGGRNIKTFEEEAGVDLIIDSEQPVIKISCFDPIKSHIAIQGMKKLIQDGRIQPQRIKEVIEAEKQNIDANIKQIGQNTVNELKILDMHPDLIYHLGMLNFRNSYSQNVLQHSIEVAKLAGAMAVELKLNDEIAVRAGLLHDIGKAKSYEIGESHVTLGVEMATKCQESDIVINAIQ